jgi:transcriptional regulator with XRE-family HTH domain
MRSKSKGIAIGRRLAAARLRRGLSQSLVARRSGLAPSYLSRIESGKISPTFATTMRIASALKLPLEELAGPKAAAEKTAGPCPVTTGGFCLLDIIRSEQELRRGAPGEAFSPRQIRMMKRFASWLRAVGPERLRAMEVLLEELTKDGTQPAPSRD